MSLQPWAELCCEIVDMGDRILSYAPCFAVNRFAGLQSLGASNVAEYPGDLLRE